MDLEYHILVMEILNTKVIIKKEKIMDLGYHIIKMEILNIKDIL